MYDIADFFLGGALPLAVDTPAFVVLAARVLFYSVELGAVFLGLRLAVGLLAIPAGWLRRQAERRLLWRLTFSHFWVVVACLSTMIISVALLALVGSPVSGSNVGSARTLAAAEAQAVARPITAEAAGHGLLAPANLAAYLRFVNAASLRPALQPRCERQYAAAPRPEHGVRSAAAHVLQPGVYGRAGLATRIVAGSDDAVAGGRRFSDKPRGRGGSGRLGRVAGAAGAGETAPARLTIDRADPDVLIAGAAPVTNATGGVALVAVVVDRPEVALRNAVQPLIAVLALGAAALFALAFVSIFGLVVALGFGYFLSRRIVRNLETLATGADLLAAGNLLQPVRLEAQDEIGRLAARFNLMAARLQESQANLEQEKRTAESALQARRELVANVSHELRTPVSTIRAHVDWLLLAAESTANPPGGNGAAGEDAAGTPHLRPGDLQQYLAIIESETQRLSLLIEDLLDLSKMEAQGPAIQLEPVTVADLAGEVKRMLGAPAQRDRRVTLTLDLAPDLPPIYADRARLGQVLVNLARNAVNYTPAGGIISIGAALADAGHVAVWVADTGIGIPPEDWERIFDRFYRNDTSRSRHTGGAGLGLAIVKTLVEAMHGTIAVESVSGEGSKFTVTLPVAGMVAAPSALPDRS